MHARLLLVVLVLLVASGEATQRLDAKHAQRLALGESMDEYANGDSALQFGLGESNPNPDTTTMHVTKPTASNWGPQLLADESNCSSGLISHQRFENTFNDPLSVLQLPRTGSVGASVFGFTAVPNASLRLVTAGVGTTGTHAIFYSLCDNGVPVVHYHRQCNVDKEAFALHQEIKDMYIQLKQCVKGMKPRRSDECNTAAFEALFKEKLVKLASSGIVALLDAPYTDVLPELLALAPQLMVLQTLRDSETWAQERIADHGGDTICRPEAAARSASFFSTVECISGTRFLADALDVQQDTMEADAKLKGKEEAVEIMAAKFAAHNSYVASIVPPKQLRQFCIWDSDFALHAAQMLADSGLIESKQQVLVRIVK